jgi:Transmembrane secretion effector
MMRGMVGVPAVRAPEHASSEEPSSALAELLAGFRFVRQHVWLWGTFLSATFAYLLFLGPSDVLLPFVVKNHLGGGPGDLGFVYAMGGLGAIGAAIVMAQRGDVRRCMTFIYVTWAIATFTVAGYGLATQRWQVVVAAFLFNALETAGTVVWATAKHRLVPVNLLGRVASFDWFISIALLPLSYGLTGPVAGVLGARTTLVGAGLLGGSVTIVFLFLPGMRAVERRVPEVADTTYPMEGLPLRDGIAPTSQPPTADVGGWW